MAALASNPLARSATGKFLNFLRSWKGPERWNLLEKHLRRPTQAFEYRVPEQTTGKE